MRPSGGGPQSAVPGRVQSQRPRCTSPRAHWIAPWLCGSAPCDPARSRGRSVHRCGPTRLCPTTRSLHLRISDQPAIHIASRQTRVRTEGGAHPSPDPREERLVRRRRAAHLRSRRHFPLIDPGAHANRRNVGQVYIIRIYPDKVFFRPSAQFENGNKRKRPRWTRRRRCFGPPVRLSGWLCGAVR